MPMLKHMEGGISGKGLGTNYTSHVRDLALRLGLRGIVFTKNDGSIKVIAEGEEEKLAHFADELKKANHVAIIENFYFNSHELNREFGDFIIG
jgi:acylphosphatase